MSDLLIKDSASDYFQDWYFSSDSSCEFFSLGMESECCAHNIVWKPYDTHIFMKELLSISTQNPTEEMGRIAVTCTPYP